VDSIFGSLAWIVGEGGVAVLYFAYRLIQFPLGIFSNALAQALLPRFSVQALDENQERLRHTLSWGLRITFLVMLPASAGFMCLAKPLVSGLFGGGRFDIYAADKTAAALFFYSLGLFAYAGIKVLQSCFFALKDTVTPTKVAFLALVMNIIFNSILMFPLKIAGLALATSISGVVSFFLLLILLIKKLGQFEAGELLISFAKILLASLGMGLVCLFLSRSLILGGFLKLFLLILSGVTSYLVICMILRVKELGELWKLRSNG
jgi:putative peptidoglycan lipid II flippase